MLNQAETKIVNDLIEKVRKAYADVYEHKIMEEKTCFQIEKDAFAEVEKYIPNLDVSYSFAEAGITADVLLKLFPNDTIDDLIEKGITPTLEQFQESKKVVPFNESLKISREFEDYIDYGVISVLLYNGGCHILDYGDKAEKRYYLIIERSEYQSNDLAVIEKTLYEEWYVSECTTGE